MTGKPLARRTAGLTLLEMLVVLAILGIIAGIFYMNLMNSIRQQDVRNAAYQLVTDLRRARTDAQKTGQPVTVRIVNSTSSYARQVAGAAEQTRTLERGVTVQSTGAAASSLAVTYQPPYGTLAATGTTWRVQSPANPNIRQFVKIVGVTGKVMISAQE
ncbi:Tfp pilus assembly protein FimT/FimU [Deinococcus taklimakanensis]|uniref:Tfp pilus assembly protein FimT/FimU n=1 Tax=Deinococcus taklimakanensis TaxID=536443 RepID=A0ABW5P1K4_9DEIO